MILEYRLAKENIVSEIGNLFDIYQDSIKIGYFQYHKLNGSSVMEIDKIYVDKKYRNKGVGKYVLASIFKQYEPSLIITCVDCKNNVKIFTPPLQFWLKQGFVANENWGHNYYECSLKKHNQIIEPNLFQ